MTQNKCGVDRIIALKKERSCKDICAYLSRHRRVRNMKMDVCQFIEHPQQTGTGQADT